MKRFITNLAIGFFHLFVIAVTNCNAQTAKPEILTNKSVIDITKAGLGNDIVISKINSSTCKFDVSTNALIDLKKQGVPDAVISSMIDKANGKVSVAQPVVSAQQTQSSNLPVISQLNYVHYYDNNKALPLEKSLGKGKSKKQGFGGYGGTQLLLEIEGATSPVKLGQGMTESFIINTGGNNLPDLALYKLKAEKSKRYAVVGKLTVKGPESGDDMLPIEFSKLGEGMYGLKPGSRLEKGEYFFTSKPNLNQSTSASDVYAFTIQ